MRALVLKTSPPTRWDPTVPSTLRLVLAFAVVSLKQQRVRLHTRTRPIVLVEREANAKWCKTRTGPQESERAYGIFSSGLPTHVPRQESLTVLPPAEGDRGQYSWRPARSSSGRAISQKAGSESGEHIGTARRIAPPSGTGWGCIDPSCHCTQRPPARRLPR